MFYRSWYDNGILSIGQLINKDGVLLSYLEFLQKFQLPVSPKEYAIVTDAIPSGAIQFFRHFNFVGRNFLADGQIFIGDIDIKKKPCIIRNALTCVTLSAAKFF